MIEDYLLVLIVLSFLAGFIDSIAGGGGLITIPAISLVLTLGPEVIGTNKVGASIAAGTAFIIYLRKGHFEFNKGVLFTIFIGVGSFLGSQLTPLIPIYWFKYFLFFTAPMVLWLIFNKKMWLHESREHIPFDVKKNALLVVSGFLVGIYDGVWGPGGGTFMLLSLLFIAKLPLMPSIAISKFANLISALTSLGGYAMSGVVVWKVGMVVALPICIGAILGASLASKKAEQVVRPILFFIVLLLLIKVYFEY